MKWKSLLAVPVLALILLGGFGTVDEAAAVRLFEQYQKAIYFDSLQTDVADDTATVNEYTDWYLLVYDGGMANWPVAQAYWNTSAGTDDVNIYFQISTITNPSVSSPVEWDYVLINEPGGTAGTAEVLFTAAGNGSMAVTAFSGIANYQSPGVVATYGRWRVQNLDDYTGSFRLDVPVESNGTNQTNLIAAKTDLFDSYTRNIRKKAWAESVNEVVKQAVANLIADELLQRRLTNDTDLEFAEYEHIRGKFTRFGHTAHSLIESIRKGAFVSDEDLASRDLIYPDPEVVTQTGSGAVQVKLPHGYGATTKDTWNFLCTTAGRVEDDTARFSIIYNYGDDDPADTDVEPTGAWQHVKYGLYVRFLDTATTGNSFEVNDDFKVIVAPLNTEAMSAGPTNFDMYTG
jgi:hypothetical protein